MKTSLILLTFGCLFFAMFFSIPVLPKNTEHLKSLAYSAAALATMITGFIAGCLYWGTE